MNDDDEVAQTDSLGAFSIEVPARSDNWLTAKLGETRFDPAGIALADIQCDAARTDFRVYSKPSRTLAGRVVSAGQRGSKFRLLLFLLVCILVVSIGGAMRRIEQYITSSLSF